MSRETMDKRRSDFLERHPDVTVEELEALTPAVRYRRYVIALAICLAITLGATLALGLRLHHVVQNDAQPIATELAKEQLAEVQTVLGARAEAGRQLAVRVFEFVVDIARDNQILRNTEAQWGDLKTRTAGLRADVAALPSTPVESSKRIMNGVPELVDALVAFVAGFLAQLDQLGPRFATALEGATDALTTDKFDPNQLLDALEVALDPIIGDSMEQRLRWQNLRAEVVAWKVGLDDDVAQLRKKVDEPTLSREFISRFIDAFVGRR